MTYVRTKEGAAYSGTSLRGLLADWDEGGPALTARQIAARFGPSDVATIDEKIAYRWAFTCVATCARFTAYCYKASIGPDDGYNWHVGSSGGGPDGWRAFARWFARQVRAGFNEEAATATAFDLLTCSLADPTAWTTGALARRWDGASCDPLDHEARSWCLAGMIDHAAELSCDNIHCQGVVWNRVRAHVQRVLYQRGFAASMVVWNDAEGRTIEQVREVVATARASLLGAAP